MQEEVVVTGIGAITPTGRTVEKTWDTILDGEVGIDRINQFDPDDVNLRSKIDAEITFDPNDHESVDSARMGRYAQIAVISAKEAIQDAGLSLSQMEPTKMGTSIASGMGGLPEADDINGRPPTRTMMKLPPNLAAGHISMEFGAKGPNRAPSTACAAGTHAIIGGAEDILQNHADIIITGGTETPLTPLGVQSFDVMRALSTRNEAPHKASRPFDSNRDGFVIGEGAGAMILESRSHAEKRDAEVYARIAGFGRTADAYHPTRPAEGGEGLQRCMSRAIASAEMDPGDIDHVNAHATSTPRGDENEAQAIKTIFDEMPPVTSNKGHLGHSLGATGAIEAVLSIKSLREGKLLPTANYNNPDPDCELPVVAKPRKVGIQTVLSNSAGFGGTNGSILFIKEEG
ncbi:beta-ketoacyl synthase [Halobacteriales archaeon QS_1_69_70]|nr:MAG: beta-ketoacyl synthase [Halobacteriales archaeon QS_1_69_70]